MKLSSSFKLLILATIFVAVISCFTVVNIAKARSLSELQLKAAYLYHFSKFVKWPTTAFANEQAEFQLCIFGQDPFGGLLDVLGEKKVKKRRLNIRRLNAIREIKNCHILYISSSEVYQWQKIFTWLVGKPSLTVSDVDDFAHKGGMVNFFRIGDKLKFEINLENVEEADLKISSTMLQVGRIVQ